MRNGEIDHVVRTIELVVILPVGPESHTPRLELRYGSECVTVPPPYTSGIRNNLDSGNSREFNERVVISENDLGLSRTPRTLPFRRVSSTNCKYIKMNWNVLSS